MEKTHAISQAQSYQEMGEFWDTHDLGEFWEQTEPAKFAVNLESEITYYAVAPTLARKLRTLAQQQGISGETLLTYGYKKK